MTLAKAILELPPVIAVSDTQHGSKSPIEALFKRLAAYRLQEGALFLLDWRAKHSEHAFRFSIEMEKDTPGNLWVKGVNQDSVNEAEFKDEQQAYEFVEDMNREIDSLVETLDEKPWRHTPAFEHLIDRLNEIEWDVEKMPGVVIKALNKFGAHGDLLLASVQAAALSQAVPEPESSAPPRRAPSL